MFLRLLPLVLAPVTSYAVDFGDYFENKTMRLDYFHTGTATEEHFALDRIVSDGPWPGSTTRLVDSLAFGKYLVQVWDTEKKTLLFSQGFATIYGEWETIGEAKQRWGAFHESVRFPWPKQPVRVVLNKRNAENKFAPVWELTVDPSARSVNPADRKSPYNAWAVQESGPARNKVDLLILGDGYTAAEMKKFHKDAKRAADALFAIEPFKSRRSDFNVWAVDTPAQESGVSRPHEGIYKRSPLSTHYSAFDSQRYVLSYDNRTLREVASAVPYEYMVILMNEQTYGGGGIFRWLATAAADNAFFDYLFVHEFGHHFAALADEYYTSSVAYEIPEITVEPWEANVTALLDPENLKWKDLVEPDTPLPTPWKKEAFDAASRATQKKRAEMRARKAPESEMEQLFRDQAERETAFLSSMKYSGKVGAFEGAGYMAKGLYRPYADCMMYTRNDVGFCPVCARAIERVIDQYTK
ncbi:MAG: IgA Peptidase M64 [Acidobacteriota bacterium]|nr:IgA Peptidase M64 [Acidobacteriota bacterium]